MNKTIKSYIFMLSVSFFWGFSFISTKVCLQWFTPFSLAFFRFLLASIVLFFTLKLIKEDVKIDKKDIIRFALCGFFGVFLYFATENLTVDMLSASLTSIFLALLPAFTTLSDYFVLKSPLTKQKLLSVSLSIIGAILVAGFNVGNSENMFLGVLLIILSMISWVIFSYLSLPIQNKYHPLKITFYQNLFGTFFFMLTMPFNMPTFEGFNATGLMHMIFLGVICSALCYLFYNMAIKNVSLVICSIFLNLMPLVTIIASIFLLNEKINLIQGIGAALIIGSVFVATGKNNETREGI